MKLYLIERDEDEVGYDEFDAAVVAAPDKDDALQQASEVFMVNRDTIRVEMIGTTRRKPGVIYKSFNAG